jgi:threonine/homoserine/homoserine lactone efflux protein
MINVILLLGLIVLAIGADMALVLTWAAVRGRAVRWSTEGVATHCAVDALAVSAIVLALQAIY